jgi:hypothetical protein
MAASIVRPPPFWLIVPSESTIRASVTTYGYGVTPDGGLLIGLPASHAWQLAPGDTRSYRLQGRIVEPARSGDDRDRPQAWEGVIDLPPVDVPSARPG